MPRLPDLGFAPDCGITFDGERVPARTGESVAVALLAAGRTLIARSAKYHRPRGPFCLAGSCNQCLARIDGLPNQRACRVACREGLTVETQNNVGGVDRDLLAIVDRVYSRGLDHHHLMTWSRFANRVTVAVSRQLAGLGTLPAAVAAAVPPATEQAVELLVVGAGPAGLAGAERLAAAGRGVLVVDGEARVGGRLRCRLGLPGDPDLAWAGRAAEAVRVSGGEVATRATVLGLWRDGGLCALVLQHAPAPRVRLVRPRRILLATGTHAQPPVFDDADLPGVLAARGLLVALGEHGVIAGQRAAVLGQGAEADATAERLAGAGMQVARVRETPRRAIGGRRIEKLELAGGERLACDTLAVATPRLAAAELARLVGAPFELDAARETFVLRAGAAGAVAPDVRVAGEVCGEMSAREAADAGRAAAEAFLAEPEAGRG